ncbi:beta-1,4-galactosyltransferase 1-like [Nerophis ophidion]|uniref:beta-1,4-galactosyltransferase 1-like n=1 Tax=Nerophis ophidion TaxID=159077 RepID=UPI002ADF2C34|nr:beta-1,4-galactosyltransferase 1-like [Nerophis ophidion]
MIHTLFFYSAKMILSKLRRVYLFLILFFALALMWLVPSAFSWLRFLSKPDVFLEAIAYPQMLPKVEPTAIHFIHVEAVNLSAGNKTLRTCPDTPPNLVGPLYVAFNSRLVLEEVWRVVGSPALHIGGRYKPLDCTSQQKVAIIIPFRNRHEHLNKWLFYLHPILIRQQLDYGVYVINQAGEGLFNRAKLLNVGFVEALKDYDYNCFVFSDVDLVPVDDRNLYRCFDSPRHLAVAIDKFQYSLPYNTYFGGVSSLSKEQYLKINGFSNTFWGWGGEDDDIYNRIIFKRMSISRPDMVIGQYKMIIHDRDLHNEANEVNLVKINQTLQTMDHDGFKSLKYTVADVEKKKLYSFITVDIGAPSSLDSTFERSLIMQN